MNKIALQVMIDAYWQFSDDQIVIVCPSCLSNHPEHYTEPDELIKRVKPINDMSRCHRCNSLSWKLNLHEKQLKREDDGDILFAS